MLTIDINLVAGCNISSITVYPATAIVVAGYTVNPRRHEINTPPGKIGWVHKSGSHCIVPHNKVFFYLKVI